MAVAVMGVAWPDWRSVFRCFVGVPAFADGFVGLGGGTWPEVVVDIILVPVAVHADLSYIY